MLQYVWQGSKYRRTFEYSKVLNMPRIMNISGFLTCQGLQYNEKSLVFERTTLIFEMIFFLIW